METENQKTFFRENGSGPADTGTVFCTANYSNTEHNFVIQNLKRPSNDLPEEYQAICIIRNIIQRGCPTRMSTFLQEMLGADISEGSKFWDFLPLVSPEQIFWLNTIKGGDNYNPAELFFDQLLPKYLKGAAFIRNLILPEASIEAITGTSNTSFVDECVDFYLPQSRLVIEIDGNQHKTNKQIAHDASRKKFLEKFNIETVRLTTAQVRSGSLDELIGQLRVSYRKNRSLYDAYKRFLEVPLTTEQITAYKATGICRFQILILELLKRGHLRLDDKDWNILVKSEDDTEEMVKLAFEDLCIWFEKILRLQRKTFKKPLLKIQCFTAGTPFPVLIGKQEILLDFSLCKRYSDENLRSKDIIFVRGAYLQTDYYQVETADLVDYQLTLKTEEEMLLPFPSDPLEEDSILLFLFREIVVPQDYGSPQVDFRPGQLEIIKNALSKKATIGLLPTGSGKSACYQLAAILQPAPSMVIAPLISLMDDQIQELQEIRFTRIETINSSSSRSKNEQRKVLERFGRGGYFFLFISPERFQNQEFREQLQTIPAMAYAIIDEAHCLSEWGHDFRTSYLTLLQTIRRYCNQTIRFLALTATASFFVRKDIKVAMSDKNHGLSEDDITIVSIVNFSRKELTFRVINTDGYHSQMAALQDSVRTIIAKDTTGTGNKPGTLIFTPYASSFSPKGAGKVKFLLSKNFEGKDDEFRSYTGQMSDDIKRDVHKRFKANEFRFLVSTKAFGMGVNKKNIRETFHFGIPGSFEGFYQEAGRAGRDGNPAECTVIFTRESPQVINTLWGMHNDGNKSASRDTILSLIESRALKNDVGAQLYLQQKNYQPVDNELAVVKYLYNFLVENKQSLIVIEQLPEWLFFEQDEKKKRKTSKEDEQSRKLAYIQKYLYRLYQLGIVQDWTINHGFGQIDILVHVPKSIDEIRDVCESQIQKYDSDFSFKSTNPIYKKYIDILNGSGTQLERYIRVLLEWNYDNFVGYRLESLHNIYETCDTYLRQLEAGKSEKEAQQEFKETVEGFFAIDKNSLVLQKLIDDQKNIELALSLIYDQSPFFGNQKTLKSKDELRHINYQLMRVLEEYRHNCSFNLLAGIVRMILDEYSDCWPRMETGLRTLQAEEDSQIRELALDTILNFGLEKEDGIKEDLSECIFNAVPEEMFAFKLYSTLEDEHSAYHVAKVLNKRTEELLNSWGNGIKS